MKHDFHVRRHWPQAPGPHAQWMGGARAVLAVSGYEVNDDGHYCIPTNAKAVVTIPKENVLAITPHKAKG